MGVVKKTFILWGQKLTNGDYRELSEEDREFLSDKFGHSKKKLPDDICYVHTGMSENGFFIGLVLAYAEPKLHIISAYF